MNEGTVRSLHTAPAPRSDEVPVRGHRIRGATAAEVKPLLSGCL